MTEDSGTVKPIGVIHSELTDLKMAPHQGKEGAPEAWLELREEFTPGLLGLNPGDDLWVLTWLHLARRDLLQVHPRGRMEAPLRGVFTVRSPHRPNPIGLHRVSVLEVAGPRLKVAPLEAIDGTPILDIKPVLGNSEEG
jgi:tRNA-Thr(GGU) m(6)t(6)A37 methyltransferase TsaA